MIPPPALQGKWRMVAETGLSHLDPVARFRPASYLFSSIGRGIHKRNTKGKYARDQGIYKAKNRGTICQPSLTMPGEDALAPTLTLPHQGREDFSAKCNRPWWLARTMSRGCCQLSSATGQAASLTHEGRQGSLRRRSGGTRQGRACWGGRLANGPTIRPECPPRCR